MGCGVYNKQVSEIENALKTMRSFGISELSSPFLILERERAKLLANIGVKLPRSVNLLARFAGFSPGVIAIYHDVESGFMAEARPTPSSPPIYHFVGGEVAMKILTHDISPELEEFLMTPDENIDN